MDRSLDAEFKRVYLLAEASYKPAVALTLVARAWVMELESGHESFLSKLTGLKSAADFVAEAMVDLVWLLSRMIAHSVAAKRALQLKHWRVDSASKQGLCLVPYVRKVRGHLACNRQKIKSYPARNEEEAEVLSFRGEV